jgi:hypothetical protein
MMYSGNLQQGGFQGIHVGSPQGNVKQSGFQGSQGDSAQVTVSQIVQGGAFIVCASAQSQNTPYMQAYCVDISQVMVSPLYQQPPPCWTPADSVGPVWTSAHLVEQTLPMMNVCSNQGQLAQHQTKQQQPDTVGQTLLMGNVWSNQGQPVQHQNKQRQPKSSKRKGKDLDQKLSHEGQVHANDENIVKERADAFLRFLRNAVKEACVNLAVAKFKEMVFAEAPDCRAAQLALEEASPPEQVILLAGLKGQIRTAMQDKNANYTVTKAVEIMPPAQVCFVSEELLGQGRVVARHRYGCRVICRLLEHSSQKNTSVMQLLEEVLEDAENLCTSSFGSIVLRHFLEHGLPEHKHRIAQALCHAKAPEKGDYTANIVICSQQRQASFAAEAAFTFCSLEDQRILAQILLSSTEQLLTVATGQFGRYILLALLRAKDTLIRKRTVEALLPMKESLDQNKCSKAVCSKLAEMKVSSDSSSTASELDPFSCTTSDALPPHAFAGC